MTEDDQVEIDRAYTDALHAFLAVQAFNDVDSGSLW